MTASQRSGIVTLLTDFGAKDPFVGVMKGVMLGVAPQLRFVDLSHDLRPQDVQSAAFWLAESSAYFPEGTVHLCVVDPGVGTPRQVVAAQGGGQLFVAPDNGVLSEVNRSLINKKRSFEVRVAPVPGPNVRATFHGRDVFAPLAARLASGQPFDDVGDVATAWVNTPTPEAVQTDAGWAGQVVVSDRFGNLITNLPPPPRGAAARAVVCSKHEIPWGQSYSDVSPGSLVALANAWDRVEIACRNDSAEDILGCGVGAAVELLLQ